MGLGVPGNGRRRARGGHGLLTTTEFLGSEAGPLGLAVGLALPGLQQRVQLGPFGELIGGHQPGRSQRLGLVFVG